MIKWMEGKEWKTTRHTNFPEINDAVFKWYQDEKSKDAIVTRTIIKRKALEVAADLRYDKFCASESWLGRWVKQFGIKLDHEAKKVTPVKRNPVKRRNSRAKECHLQCFYRLVLNVLSN